ncbi:hypothetical protein D3C71_1812520 [compost metagenome]
MQRAIEERLVELAVHSHVAFESEGVPLNCRHSTHAGLKIFDLMANGRDLAVDHPDLGIGLGET